MTTLRSLVDTVGGTDVLVLAAPRGLDVPAHRLLLHDPDEPVDAEPGDVVLGVGAGRARDALRLLGALAGSGAAALVVREPAAQESGLAREAAAGPVALLAVPRETAWAQVVQVFGSALSRAGLGAGADRGVQAQSPDDDLFAVANVIADLIDAPVTIEDPQHRVIAFSRHREQADPARQGSVLGRHVPADWVRRHQEQGAFQWLARERDPIYLGDMGPGILPRVAIAVRAGDSVLGSVWAAVHGPLSPAREQALRNAAGFVALHLLRHQLGANLDHTLERELVMEVLDGGALAGDALGRLGLAGAGGFRVVAVGLDRPPSEDDELVAARCRDALAMQLAASHPGARAVVHGTVVYTLLPMPREDRRAAVEVLHEQLRRFAARAEALVKARVLVGVGSNVAVVDDVPDSRESADEALRVLSHEPSRGPVADIAQLRSAALLLRFARECAGDPLATTGPLRVLQEHDARRGTDYVPTLRAYLDAFGDVDVAAADLRVHANTVRYRLHQMRSLVRVDLGSPTERLALMLQLHVLAPG
jgi:hypothetical protein